MPDQQSSSTRPGGSFVLFMLFAVYTLNFLDRQLVSILAVPLRAEFLLSDTQLGLIGGLAFALFYTALGVPVAVLADRFSRTWIITVGLALWSAMTALCGLAQNFGQLFLARLGVGVGEAGGVAPSHALISDYFPPESRARALSVYSLAIPTGSAAGLILGGLIAASIDWRFAFLIMGVAGLVLAPIFRLSVPEPPRNRQAEHEPVRDVAAALARKPAFWLLSVATAFSSIIGYALLFWLPSLLVRSHGLTLTEAGLYAGLLILLGGGAGILAGGWFADRLAPADRAAYAWVPALGFLVTVPALAAGVLVPSAGIAFAVLLLPVALSMAWLGPVLAAIQGIVRSSMRATASAVFLLINNLLGLGAGSVIMGALSDAGQQSYGDDSLRFALLAGSSLYLVAAVLLFLGGRRLADDWEDELPVS